MQELRQVPIEPAFAAWILTRSANRWLLTPQSFRVLFLLFIL